MKAGANVARHQVITIFATIAVAKINEEEAAAPCSPTKTQITRNGKQKGKETKTTRMHKSKLDKGTASSQPWLDQD